MKYLIALALCLVPLAAGAQSLTVTNQKNIEVITKQTPTISADNPSANRGDFIALYVAGSITRFDWFYVGTGTKTQPVKGVTSGTVKLPNLKPGSYEAKLFALTTAGMTLSGTKPFVVELTSVEIQGLSLVVTRRPGNDPDQLSIVFDGVGGGTLLAPKDTSVITKP